MHSNWILGTQYIFVLSMGNYRMDAGLLCVCVNLSLSLSLSPHTRTLAQPIVITPEGNKYWLSTENVLAKGVPENEVENFK